MDSRSTFKPIYMFAQFIAEINKHLEPYELTTASNIVEHAILLLGNLPTNPIEETCWASRLEASETLSTKDFAMDLGLSPNSIRKLVANLKVVFLNADVCEYTPKYNNDNINRRNPKYNRQNSQAILFSLPVIRDNTSLIKQTIDKILSDPSNLLVYQQNALEDPRFNTTWKKFEDITTKFGISVQYTDCAEILLLKMFGCKDEELENLKARFQPEKSFVNGKLILAPHFYLSISEAAARNLVAAINQFAPASAHFIGPNLGLWDKGPVNLCKIAVDYKLLSSTAFLTLFNDTLFKISVDEPFLVEALKHLTEAKKKPSQTEEAPKKTASSYTPVFFVAKPIPSSRITSSSTIYSSQQIAEAFNFSEKLITNLTEAFKTVILHAANQSDAKQIEAMIREKLETTHKKTYAGLIRVIENTVEVSFDPLDDLNRYLAERMIASFRMQRQ